MNKFHIIISCLLLASCMATPKGFNKPNFSYNRYAPDVYACGSKMKKAEVQPVNMPANTGNAGSFAGGFIEGVAKSQAKRTQLDIAKQCMLDKGYVFEEITAEERDKRIQASLDHHKKLFPEKYKD